MIFLVRKSQDEVPTLPTVLGIPASQSITFHVKLQNDGNDRGYTTQHLPVPNQPDQIYKGKQVGIRILFLQVSKTEKDGRNSENRASGEGGTGESAR